MELTDSSIVVVLLLDMALVTFSCTTLERYDVFLFSQFPKLCVLSKDKLCEGAIYTVRFVIDDLYPLVCFLRFF